MKSILYKKVEKSCVSFILDILDDFGEEATDERIIEEIEHMIIVYDSRRSLLFGDEDIQQQNLDISEVEGNWKKEYQTFKKFVKEYSRK